MTEFPLDSAACSQCQAAIGERHKAGCSVARCAWCGVQAISGECRHLSPGTTWRGFYPGTMECREWGWMIDTEYGEQPDINKLMAAFRFSRDVAWDRTAERYQLRTEWTP